MILSAAYSLPENGEKLPAMEIFGLIGSTSIVTIEEFVSDNSNREALIARIK